MRAGAPVSGTVILGVSVCRLVVKWRKLNAGTELCVWSAPLINFFVQQYSGRLGIEVSWTVMHVLASQMVFCVKVWTVSNSECARILKKYRTSSGLLVQLRCTHLTKGA